MIMIIFQQCHLQLIPNFNKRRIFLNQWIILPTKMMNNNVRCMAITGRNTCCRRINNFVSEYCNQHDNIIQEQPEFQDCCICLDSINIPVKLDNCIHSFCRNCIYKWIVSNNTCPTCRSIVPMETCNTALRSLLFTEYLIDIQFVEYSVTTLNPEELIIFNNHFGINFKYFTPYNMLKYYQLLNLVEPVKGIFDKIKIITAIKYFKSSPAFRSIPGGVLYIFTN